MAQDQAGSDRQPTRHGHGAAGSPKGSWALLRAIKGLRLMVTPDRAARPERLVAARPAAPGVATGRLHVAASEPAAGRTAAGGDGPTAAPVRLAGVGPAKVLTAGEAVQVFESRAAESRIRVLAGSERRSRAAATTPSPQRRRRPGSEQREKVQPWAFLGCFRGFRPTVWDRRPRNRVPLAALLRPAADPPSAVGDPDDRRSTSGRQDRRRSRGQPRAGALRGSSSGTASPYRGSAAGRSPELLDPVQLEPGVKRELRSLASDNAEHVGGIWSPPVLLLEMDPSAALRHAQEARRSAGRLASVREAVAVSAYAAGDFEEAAREIRAVRRMSGSDDLLPLLADSERALGRPERALALSVDPAVRRLPKADQIEMLIVASGARRDLGQAAAAVVTLQIPELTERPPQPWTLRLNYAYAAALRDAGRTAPARTAFEAVAALDEEGETDAFEVLEGWEAARSSRRQAHP